MHRLFPRCLRLMRMTALAWLLSGGPGLAATFHDIEQVFVIVMENTDWKVIKGSGSAPYINQSLLPVASYAEQYKTFPNIHPSPGNYVWLEAGTNFGILDDGAPALHPLATTNHLVDLLEASGISWRVYAEGISGTNCPTEDVSTYIARHNPFMFFTDITGDANRCRTHVRPYNELMPDLLNDNSARYNFLIPDRCNDGHDYCSTNGQVWQMDYWLSQEIPKLTNSPAYRRNGAIFLLWDEGSFQTNGVQGDGPVPCIILSPLAKGHGYSNSLPYTHSSTLRTVQEIFGVWPFLGDAANANDLSDLFNFFELQARIPSGPVPLELTISGLLPGQRTVVQTSQDCSVWNEMTNFVPTTATVAIEDRQTTTVRFKYYRALIAP